VLREATEWPSGNHSTGWWARHRSLYAGLGAEPPRLHRRGEAARRVAPSSRGRRGDRSVAANQRRRRRR